MLNEMETEVGATDYALLYRNATTTSQPIVDHKHLQFIHTNNDERILLGACNLTGRFRNGSVWLFDDSSNFSKSNAYVNSTTESAVSDAAFVDNEKFVVVEDSGVLQVSQIVENPHTRSKEIQCLGYTCQHDDGITSASLFFDKNRLVTAGMDCCIKVWNLTELLAEYSYDGAHRRIVTCVDAKCSGNDVFASCGLDCEVAIWDIRKDNPAQVVSSKDGRRLSSVAWHPGNENFLAVGSNDGFITIIDVRKPNDFVRCSNFMRRSVHKLKFHPRSPHLLAACSDDTELKVIDTTKDCCVVYHDRRHTDFIRGLAWYGGNVLSCSWDNTVMQHDITSLGTIDK